MLDGGPRQGGEQVGVPRRPHAGDVPRGRATRAGLLALLAALTLTGCRTEKDGRTYPDGSDLDRARAVWSDPWVVPDSTTLVGPDGPAPHVERVVAGRGYATPAVPRAVALTEVRAATAAGWRLVGAQCDPDEQGFAGSVTVQLARGSSVDDGARATLSATTRSATPAATPTPTATALTPEDAITQVAIDAAVPHHLDASWPSAAGVDLDRSCLVVGPAAAGRPSSPAPEPEISRLPGDRVDLPGWTDDVLPDSLRATLEDLAGDPGLRSLGLSLARPRENPETGERTAASATSDALTGVGALATTVTSLTSQGWTLTYAGCLGPGAPNVAFLSRPAGGRHAVLRLSQVPAAGSDGPLSATAVVSTPGYSPDAPAASVDVPCFNASPAPTSLSHTGTPHLGPTRMFPLIR